MNIIGKSAGSVAAEIVMSRQNWSGSFLVVEGPSDFRFFGARKHGECQLVLGWGRSNVEGAIQILDGRREVGVCGLIDDDFDSLPGAAPVFSENLVRTDPHDLEGILLRSSAFDKAIAEFCDSEAVSAFLQSEPPSLREALVRRALLFGSIHFVNGRGRQVCLDELKPMRFIHQHNWSYDESAAKDLAVRLGVAPDVPTLDREIAHIPPCPPWALCRGHDLVDILFGGVLRVLGGRRATPPNLELVLRSGIEKVELDSTSMMRSFRDWENRQAPFRLLP